MRMPKAAALLRRSSASTGSPTCTGPPTNSETMPTYEMNARSWVSAQTPVRPFHTSARMPPSGLGGWKSVWMRMRYSDTSEKMKLTASTLKARPMPPASANRASWLVWMLAATSRPARTGPTIIATWRMPMIMPLAACRCSFSTSCGRMELPAGYTNAVDRPTPREMAYTSHIWTAPVTTSTASAATKAAFQAREMRRMRRGELRSTTAPPTNMKTARGTACSNKVRPTAAGSWVSLSTSQGSATRVKVSPMAEMLLPENSSMKSRLENTEVFGAGTDMAADLYIGVRIMPQPA